MMRLFGLITMAVLLLSTYVNGKSVKTEETRSDIIQILKRLVQYDQQGNLVKKDDIQDRVHFIFEDQIGQTVQNSDRLYSGGLELDDLDIVEVIMEIEAEFGIGVPDDQAARWQTVGDVVAYVRVVA